jgi:hypothetical protein
MSYISYRKHVCSEVLLSVHVTAYEYSDRLFCLRPEVLILLLLLLKMI